MKNPIIFVAAVLALLCLTLGTLTPTVWAQDETPETPEATATLGWIVVAWLFYSILGLLAAASTGQTFDGMKFAKTFLITLIVAVIAFALRIPPATAVTQYGAIIDQIVTIIINTGPGMMLIYALEKLWKMIVAWKAKWEQARQAATGPSQPRA